MKHISETVFSCLMSFLAQPGDVVQSCDITLEPVSCRQKLLPESVQVCLKGVLRGWDASSLTQTSTDLWVLQSSSSGLQGAAAFQHLLMELSAHGLQMVRKLCFSSTVQLTLF